MTQDPRETIIRCISVARAALDGLAATDQAHIVTCGGHAMRFDRDDDGELINPMPCEPWEATPLDQAEADEIAGRIVIDWQETGKAVPLRQALADYLKAAAGFMELLATRRPMH